MRSTLRRIALVTAAAVAALTAAGSSPGQAGDTPLPIPISVPIPWIRDLPNPFPWIPTVADPT